MHPDNINEAINLAKGSDFENVIICPPTSFIQGAGEVLTRAGLGAQNLEFSGTGDVDAKELKSLGVTHVIIGHSDRRKNHNETNEIVAKKVSLALSEGLVPVICVGETKEERDAGKKMEVVNDQVVKALSEVKGGRVILAYEPVWSISTNIADGEEVITPEEAYEVILFIKQIVEEVYQNLSRNVIYVYGGSVNSENVKEFLEFKEVGGALVGSASLSSSEFSKMIKLIN